MIECNLSEKDSLVRRLKIMLIVVLAFVLVAALSLWIYVDSESLTILWISPYRAVVPGEPPASGKVYSLPDGRHLLVLTSKSSKHPEGYCVDLAKRRIGLASVPNYVPLFRSALVHEMTLEGFGFEEEVDADWDVKNGWEEVRVRIRGLANALERLDPSFNPGESTRKMMPIGYQREIILTRGDRE